MKELTKRQKEILSFIADYKHKNSYPPTFREIAEHFKISVKGAHDHVTALKRKGYIIMADKRSRTMGLLHTGDEEKSDFEKIPIYGTIAAGTPILAEENFDGNILLHKTMLKTAKKNKEYFALRVKGDSMTGAGIFDGDTAIIEKQNTVNNGEIAAAVVDDAYTLKRFYKESARIRLQAENPAYKPIYSRDVKILGRLYKIIRDY
jgi:repressor LexA